VSTNVSKIGADVAAHLEQVEVAAWTDFCRAATREAVAACGIGLANDVSVSASTASKIDVLALNRVVGLGMSEAASEEQLDELVSFYQRRKVRRFFVQVCPKADPGDLPAWLERRGFTHYNNWIKLWRGVEPCPPVDTDLRVRRIGKTHAASFARILVTSFDWPRPLETWVTQMVGRRGWRHYMAFDREAPAATAALFVDGENGWIDFASTLPEYRGRGAQGALVEKRIRDAAEMGCKRLVVETAEEKPGHSAPSYRNMRRFGFETAYTRPNYIYINGSQPK
jgi:GNAT superfamily N-acetyltransferase